MAVKFIKQRKKQKYLILIFIAVLLITSFVLWFGFFKKEEISTLTAAIAPREIKIDFEVLNNPLLKEFKPFIKVFPFEGLVGRENPFLPY